MATVKVICSAPYRDKNSLWDESEQQNQWWCVDVKIAERGVTNPKYYEDMTIKRPDRENIAKIKKGDAV